MSKRIEELGHLLRAALLAQVENLEQHAAELRRELADTVARLNRNREQLKSVLP